MKEVSMGQMIREVRLSQKMTQETLAEDICSLNYLSKVEHGSQIPSREIYQKLMERLGESGYSYAYWLEEKKRGKSCRKLLYALQERKTQESLTLLSELGEMKGAWNQTDRDFYAMSHLLWTYVNGAIDKNTYFLLCKNMWEERRGPLYPFWNQSGDGKFLPVDAKGLDDVEVWMLNNIAIGYLWMEDAKDCFFLLRWLYLGQREKEAVEGSGRRQSILCYNLALCMLEIEKPKEALTYLKKARASLLEEGGLYFYLCILRLEMEAQKMLGQMDDFYRSQILLHNFYHSIKREAYNKEKLEKVLWLQRELLVFY